MTELMMKMLFNSNSPLLDIMVEEHVADCCSCGEINSYPVSPCVCYTLQNDSMKPKPKPKKRRTRLLSQYYYQNNLHIPSFCNSLLSAHRHAAVLLRALCRCTLCHHCTEKITNFLRSLFTTNPCCDKAIKGITDTVRVRYSSNNGRNTK